MNTPDDPAEHYRQRATELRERSERAGTAVGRSVLLQAARSWDDMAERCDAETADLRRRAAA